MALYIIISRDMEFSSRVFSQEEKNVIYFLSFIVLRFYILIDT